MILFNILKDKSIQKMARIITYKRTQTNNEHLNKDIMECSSFHEHIQNFRI